MNNDDYKNTLHKIKASDSFKRETLKILEEEMKEKDKESVVIKMHNKKINKRTGLVAACCVIALGLGTMTYIGGNNMTPDGGISPDHGPVVDGSQGKPTAKVMVNIEGIIVEVAEDGKSFKLDSGLWVDINEDTELGAMDPDTSAPGETNPNFNDQFEVGNFVTGFTLDDTERDRVTAYAIYSNRKENLDAQVSAKVMVNIEGTITEVAEDGKSFKLDNDQWVEINHDTELGAMDPDTAKDGEKNPYFNDTFEVGNSIAGFTLDDTEGERVTAYAIYSNHNWDK